MADMYISPVLVFSLFTPLLLILLLKWMKTSNSSSNLPKSYPVFGSYFLVNHNFERFVQWTAGIVNSTSSLTFTLQEALGQKTVFTANPSNVHHILKSHFHIYEKGDFLKTTLRDFLGDGIFNADADKWKFQRQLASHEFNTKSLRKFIETVVESELSGRLIPILRTAALEKKVIDLQDILQRFAFDNICKIAFGYDPAYLTPSLEESKFAVAFETAVRLSSARFGSMFPAVWKFKRALNLGSERELKSAVTQVQSLAKEILNRKKQQIGTTAAEDEDLLSRFLNSGHNNEEFVMDIVISFILAGRDTTSAALTWFFWLLSKHPEIENKIFQEVNTKISESVAYDEVKELIYTHASICESMRLYPPVPMDTKCAITDDVLPDGTIVKKGMRVTYHPYAMGRVEKVWGEDWAEYRPERWLGEKGEFVNKDAYTYPVFQAGPRICLGKEMAFLQMKSIVAAVLHEFKVVPVIAGGEDPVYLSFLTAKMKGGFPVRIEVRAP